MEEIVIHETARRHPAEFALGAYRGGELIGLAVCDTSHAPTASMVVVVKPQWRQCGIGRALMHRMIERASEVGLVFLTMSFGADNEAASKMLAGCDAIVARRHSHGVVKVALTVQPNVSVVPIAA